MDLAKLSLPTEVYPQITETIIGAEEAIRETAPYGAAILVGAFIMSKVAKVVSNKWTQIDKLASAELSYKPTRHQTKLGKFVRGMVAGTALTAVGSGFVGALDAVGEEVQEGPNRPIATLIEEQRHGAYNLLGTGANSSILSSNKEAMFMNTQYIDRRKLDNLSKAAAEAGINVSPFYTSFANYENADGIDNSALVIVPGENTVSANCDEPLRVSVDKTGGSKIGDQGLLNGVPIVVTQVTGDSSSMNRVGIKMDESSFACYTGIDNMPYFGAVVNRYDGQPVNQDAMDGLIIESGLHNKAVLIDAASFKDVNKDFWSKNAAAIFLISKILTASAIGLGAAGLKKSYIQNQRREISMMLADGGTKFDIQVIESLRALKEGLVGGAAGVLAAPVIATVFNAAVNGLEAGITPQNAAEGVVFVSLVNLYAAKSAAKTAANFEPAEIMG